ncbi:MAG: DMT family transporter [Clostridia bacterium]|nr:DMT family transporter [Clostridia bacterium]
MHIYLQLVLTLIAGLAFNLNRKYFTVRSRKGLAGRAVFSAICAMVAAVVLLVWGGFGHASTFTLLLGILFGTVTAIQSIANISAVSCGPMSYTTIITSFSVLISALSGMLFFGEDKLEIIQIIGVVLMLTSIALSAKGKGEDEKVNFKWLILAFTAFLLTGAIGIMQKIHQTSEYKSEINAFLIIAFVVSALISTAFALIKLKKTQNADTLAYNAEEKKTKYILFAIVIVGGICTAANNKFNLFLSGALPTAIFFPVYNVGILILTTLSAIVIFKERLSLKQWIGVVIGIISVICIRNPFA